MNHKETHGQLPTYKVKHGVYLGVLMSPTEVAQATRSRDDQYISLHRWTLCGEVSPAVFDILQLTQMRPGNNERVTALTAPSGLNYALFTHQVAMFQHRYVVPLFDRQVAECIDKVGHQGGLGYSLAGEGELALVWPSTLAARDVMPLQVLCSGVPEGREEQALEEYSRMLSDAQDPQRIPSLVEGCVVRHVSVSAIPPRDVVERMTRRYGTVA